MLPFAAVFALAGLVIAVVWAIRTTRDKRRSMPARAHAPSRRPWLLVAGASCTLASFSFAVAAIACSQLVRQVCAWLPLISQAYETARDAINALIQPITGRRACDRALIALRPAEAAYYSSARGLAMSGPFLLLAALGLQLFSIARWDRLDEDVRRRSDLKTSIASPVQSPIDERPPVDSSRPWQQVRAQATASF